VYILIGNHTSRYRLVQLNGDLSADLAHGETPLPSAGGKIRCRRYFYQAEIQRRAEEKRRETRPHPKVIPSSISQLPNPCSNDHHPRSMYLGIGPCWNCQGGRASARGLASMGASTSAISRCSQSDTSIASYSLISNTQVPLKWLYIPSSSRLALSEICAVLPHAL